MALLFVDGFNHYVTADLAKKWPTVATLTISGSGRFGNGLVMNSNGASSVQRPLSPSGSTVIVGLAIYPTLFTYQNLLWIRSGTTVVCRLMIDAGGYPYLNSTVATWTSSKPIPISAWTYLELKVSLATGATGSLEIRQNGETVASQSNVITGAATTWDSIAIGGAASNGSVACVVDDLYVCDGSGSTNNDFLGDIKVVSLFPTGAGTTTQWTRGGTDSGANWSQVEETSPSTTDYVESSTVGNKDTYAYGNLTNTTGTVYGVQVLPYAAKTDAGSRSIVSIARHSGTEVDSSAKVLSTTPIYLPDVRENCPGQTGWTITQVNDAEFGVKVNA